MNKFLGILVLLIIGQAVLANVFEHEKSLEYISQKIPPLNGVNCKFYQEKYTAGTVLKSSGDFSFDKNKGITFYTTFPIKSTVTYNSKESRKVNEIITAISNKSYSRLEKEFQFFYTDGWTLGLLPKKGTQAYDYLKSIEIKGNQNMIVEITILTTNSTKTKIRFQ